MGTLCSKLTRNIPASTTTTAAHIDYGSLSPQGIYTTDTDYDLHVVRSLIRKSHLAPFYKGFNEASIVNKLAYETECPICFLFYPSKMNRTRCCDKTICTECFLQLKRSASSPLVPAVCPFCVQPNLGVIYIPPPWSKQYDAFKKRRSDLFITSTKEFEDDHQENDRRTWRIEANDPDVVLVDTVRPRWYEMLEERRSSTVGSTRRRRVQLNNIQRYEENDVESHHTIYDTIAEMDLEDVLVMEAIRLSLLTTTAGAGSSAENHGGDDEQGTATIT